MIISTHTEHRTVFRQPGRFGGWPANYGMWSWDDEIALVYVEGAFANVQQGHKRDKHVPFATIVARSIDGGENWENGPFRGPTPKNCALSADEHMAEVLQIGNPYKGENPPVQFEGSIDFLNPEISVLVARTTCHDVPAPIYSWFHVSNDRGRSWTGPYRFEGICDDLLLSSRTDIVPISAGHALFLLSTHKSNGEEGKVLCAETVDGGRTFNIKSSLRDDEPTGFEIMPSSIRLENGSILTTVRTQALNGPGSIDLYESTDVGVTWNKRPSAVESLGPAHSNPPALVQTKTGRLCVVFGYRNPPFGMRARYSDDNGKTWSKDIVLRDDGGDPDLGYPRAVLRSDGKIVTAYYYNTHTDSERFIGATVWDADRE
jgi:hypothetical protein